jgi:hypothetical protein
MSFAVVVPDDILDQIASWGCRREWKAKCSTD